MNAVLILTLPFKSPPSFLSLCPDFDIPINCLSCPVFSMIISNPKNHNFSKAAIAHHESPGWKSSKASATESNPENQSTCPPPPPPPPPPLLLLLLLLPPPVMCVPTPSQLPSTERGRTLPLSPSVLAVFGPSALLIRMSKLISFGLIHQQGRDWNCTRPA